MRLLCFLLFITSFSAMAEGTGLNCVAKSSCLANSEVKGSFLSFSDLSEVVDADSNIDDVDLKSYMNKDVGLAVVVTVGRFSTLFLYDPSQVKEDDIGGFSLKFETGLISEVMFDGNEISIKVYSNDATESPYIEKFKYQNGCFNRMN